MVALSARPTPPSVRRTTCIRSCTCTWLLISTLLAPAAAVPLDNSSPPGFVLNDFVKHWEAAHYELDTLKAHRSRRETPSLAPLNLNFRAHDREFRLKLHPDASSVFANDVEFHNSQGPLQFHPSNVYSGSLDDDEYSFVHGVITSDGLFDGTIFTRQDVFYVEPLHRYGKTHSKIHSVIYKTSDVVHPLNNSTLPCASHLLHMKELGKVASKHQSTKRKKKYRNSTNQGTIVKYLSNVDSNVGSLRKLKRTKRWLPSDDDNVDVFKLSDIEDDGGEQEYVAPLKNPSLPIDLYVPYYSESDDSNLETIINRIKNNTDRTRGILISSYDDDNYGDTFSRPNSKNHVEIKSKINVQGDIITKKPVGYTIVSSLMGNVTDSALRHVNKRATIDPKKTTCMLYLQADHQFFQKFGSEEACIEVMTRHVQRVNSIYRVTDFNQDGKPDNITFMIKRIKVHTVDAVKDPLYRFPNNYGVEKFLELFSEEDYDGFCLAYMFTYRDFEMGTLGLAWTGDLKNAGGVCEKNGHYRGSLKSLNTGIVTLLNYGKHVPPAVSHVTLAHEIGHNFGSPHDPDVCTPGGEDGNFIMFARATSGDKRNNNHFSPCSLKSINPVLNNKARSSKGCFTEPQISLCGNGVVEEGEECDCGWEGDCRDPCCYPQRRHPPPGESPCRLTPRSVCSPSQGPCCTSQCSLRFGDECRTDNGCRDSSHCDGRRPHCPPSISKPNRTVCDDGFVCYMGECTGSICLAYGLESCQCSADRACDLCCRLPGPGNPCRSSFHWNSSPYDVPDMFAKPGTPCNEYNGYCDVFQKCREVDPSGPLATLRKLLLSEESLSSFRRWIGDHWYAVALIILGVIALLVGSTRLLGKRSDGKLKSVTIIHSSTTETVRLPEHCQDGVIVHTAIRSKVPLKKKVALRTRSHRNKKDKNRDSEQSPRTNNGKNSKKRIAAPVATEELLKQGTDVNTSQVEAVAIKLRKSGTNKHKTIIARRKNKKNKEVIDYSAAQKDADKSIPGAIPIVAEADSLGKVQNWLLNTPRPALITKSKSTPVGLTDKTFTTGSKGNNPSKATRSKHDKSNSKSVNNLSQGEKDKVRLQVIYKPPFKFSLKLCKGDKTRVVVDKSTHTRPDLLSKKKSHIRLSKVEDVGRLNKPVSNSIVPVNDVVTSQNSQITQLSNTATVGLSNGPDSSYYEKVNNSLTRSSNDERVSQRRKIASKWSHKKSNSVGHGGNATADSRQNLLNQVDYNSSHFYENIMATGPSTDNIDNHAKQTSSMPRNNANHNKHGGNSAVQSLRMSSQRMAQRNGRHVKKSFSNASQQHGGNHLQKGSSLNNLNLDIEKKKNSLSHRKRSSMAAEQVYSNIEPTCKFNIGDEKQKRLLKLSGADGSRGHLRRQMSATELYKSPPHVDFFMPMSAGADHIDACRPEFEWMQGKTNSTDNQVPLNVSDSRVSRDCLESQIVPNISDNQTPLEPKLLENHVKKSHVPKNASFHSTRQQTSQGDSSVCSFSDSYRPTFSQWPQTFSDLKHTLPDSSQVVDSTQYQSDMEVLVSDNDFSLYDV